MRVLAVLAAALLIPQEKNEAEELFKKAEVKLAGAKTLRIEFESSLHERKGDKEVSAMFTGSIVLAEENRARLEGSTKLGPKHRRTLVVSDGRLTGVEGTDSEGCRPAPTSANLNRDVRLFVLRTGAMSSVLESQKRVKIAEAEGALRELGKEPKPREDDPRKTLKLSAFKMAGREKVGEREAVKVEFTVEDSKHPERALVTLWLDMETHLPLQCSARAGYKDNRTILIFERYTSFRLDEKIDPAKFELPKEK